MIFDMQYTDYIVDHLKLCSFKREILNQNSKTYFWHIWNYELQSFWERPILFFLIIFIYLIEEII